MQRGREGHKIVCDFIGFHKHAENGEEQDLQVKVWLMTAWNTLSNTDPV